jgi:hypothetical protein
MKENDWSKLASRTSFSVASKSRSVSPGKPTMMSVDTDIDGRTARSRRSFSLNSSAV